MMGKVITLTEVRRQIKVHHPHQVKLKRIFEIGGSEGWKALQKISPEMRAWCKEQTGGKNGISACLNLEEAKTARTTPYLDASVARYEYNKDAPWIQRNYTFMFKDPNMAFAFKMRWG